ncbi:pirin family protein [Flavobacterium sp. NST-5]|uniref:Pirin family protein n=1 Tax=Flavobacterium ichthyis TaxID=2698827 RepID=A0ABW9Z636_9FLAO|nr:pirin family protein [Flavobacterium ichthyis]NBL64139.1 pirin family protein [Flavobacterium ichthyis]
MEKSILHKAATRGHANHGWLEAYHTFSFAGYQDPSRMNFGVLRVLNDDTISGGMGFGKHPHDNMEIITIPLEGALEHEDSMGNKAVIRKGEIQVMSAGTGVFHSEYNPSETERTKLLQIWVFPNKRNVEPRYDQISLNEADRHNQLQQILSPNAEDEGVWIHQDAWFHLGKFDENFKVGYDFKKSGNGVYAFVLNGKFEINGQELDQRDGFGISGTEKISITALTNDAEILLMEVPMFINFK